MTNQEAYEKCRDDWKVNDNKGGVKTKEQFAAFVGCDLPESVTKYDPDHTVAALILEGRKQAINEIAEKSGANWRIRVSVHGASVVKLEDTRLVEDDVPSRWKRIANAMVRARGQFQGLLGLTTLSKKDRKVLRWSVGLFEGTMLALTGSLNQIQGIPAIVKQELIEIIKPIDNGDEDEEE